MKITVIKGDITKVTVDAVVNAANSSLLGGGGVDGAIHRAGGPKILEECRRIGFCETGDAVLTSGGNLPCSFVIHTVGPVWHGGDRGEKEQLKNCYENSLKLAVKNNIKTIAFPNISTGVYGFPKNLAAQTAATTVKDFLRDHPEIEKVIFVCFDDENYQLMKKLI